MKMRILPLIFPLSALAACAVAPSASSPRQASGVQAPAQFPSKPSGWLGVVTEGTVDASLRADLGLPGELSGLLVLGAIRGASAHGCGIASGDFLVSIDGRSLSEIAQIKAAGGGSKVSFGVRRNGKSRTVSCALGYYPAVLGLSVNDSPSGLQLVQPPNKLVEKSMKRIGWPTYPVFIRSIDAQPVAGASQAKVLLSGRKPLETVELKLESARTKKPQKIQLLLNEGAPESREFAEESPSSREPRTLTVSPEGSGDFKTIRGALLMSQPGDSVFLRAGRYREEVLISVSKRTLRGEGPSTVLEGGFSVSGTDGSTVEDLSVEMKPAPPQAQSLPVSASVRQARGTTLRRLTLTGGFGVNVADSQDTVIEDCVVRKARLGLGIRGSTFKVLRSVFHDNEWGVQAAGDSVGTLRGLTVADNRVQGVMVDASRIELYDSILSANPTLLTCQNGCRFSGGYNDYHEGNLCSEGDVRGRGATCVPASEGSNASGLRKESDVSVDPLFAERLRGDYRLSLESPLIGRGRGGGHIGALPPAGSGSGSEGFK